MIKLKERINIVAKNLEKDFKNDSDRIKNSVSKLELKEINFDETLKTVEKNLKQITKLSSLLDKYELRNKLDKEKMSEVKSKVLELKSVYENQMNDITNLKEKYQEIKDIFRQVI